MPVSVHFLVDFIFLIVGGILCSHANKRWIMWKRESNIPCWEASEHPSDILSWKFAQAIGLWIPGLFVIGVSFYLVLSRLNSFLGS